MRLERPTWAVNNLHSLHKLMQGVFFMCRQNLLYGGCLLAFGLGMLIGTWLTSGIVCHFFGFGMILLGFCVIRRC